MTTFWLFLGMALIVLVLGALAFWAVVCRNRGLFGDGAGDDGLPYSRWKKGDWDDQ